MFASAPSGKLIPYPLNVSKLVYRLELYDCGVIHVNLQSDCKLYSGAVVANYVFRHLQYVYFIEQALYNDDSHSIELLHATAVQGKLLYSEAGWRGDI